MKNKTTKLLFIFLIIIFFSYLKMNIIEAKTNHYGAKEHEKSEFGNISECYYLLPNTNIWHYPDGKNVFFTNDSDRAWMAYRFFRYDFGIRTFNGNILKNAAGGGNEFLTNPLLINGGHFPLNFDMMLSKIESDGKGVDYSTTGCPKYLKFYYNDDYNKRDIEASNNDSGYQDFLKNYYNADWSNATNDDGVHFQIDSYHVPAGTSSDGYFADNIKNVFILPLYSYWDKSQNFDTEDEGDWTHTGERCYLSDNLNKTQDKCSIKYTGKNPAEIYIDSNAIGYTKVFDNSVKYFREMCGTNNIDSNISYLKKLINNPKMKKPEVSVSDECWSAMKQFKNLYYSHNQYVALMQNDKLNKSYYTDYYEKKFNSTQEKTSKFLNNENILTTNIKFDVVEEEIARYISFQSLMDDEKGEENFKGIISLVFEMEKTEKKYVKEDFNYIKNLCEREEVTLSEEQLKECQRVYSEICYPQLEKNLRSTNVSDVRNSFIMSFHDCMDNNFSGYKENVLSKVQDAESQYVALVEQYKQEYYSRVAEAFTATPMPTFVIHNTPYEADCDDIIALRIIWIILRIAAPIITVALGIFDFAKAVVAGDDAKISKAKQSFSRRLIALVLFILIPIIISTILSLVDEEKIKNIDLARCIINGS